MLRLPVDKGLILPLNVWDKFSTMIQSSWSIIGIDGQTQQLEIMNALFEVGAESRTNPLSLVKYILIQPGTWRSHNADFEAALAKAIAAFCERDLDPYANSCESPYMNTSGSTLWLDFIRSIPPSPELLSIRAKGLILVILKMFVGLGAQLNDVEVYTRSQFTVSKRLRHIFTNTEMEGLELLQRGVKAKSSKAKTSRAQSRRGKKKRRGRKMEQDIEWEEGEYL